MVFKYFIEFDDDGEVGCLCKTKPKECLTECGEYIVKLTLIERSITDKISDKLTESVNSLHAEAGKLTSEMKKVSGKIRRSFK